jgi:ABC-type glycerol-3-phosphate transport system substrate-binding protein
MADPRQSGGGHMVCEIILQAEGWDKGWQTLNGIAANATSWSSSSSAIPDDIASGEAVFGPIIDFYAATKIAAAGKDKLGYVESSGENLVTPDPIAILRGAPHKALAEKFVAFVMSPQGQKLWMLPVGAAGGPEKNALYRRPIAPSAYPLPKNALMTGNPYAVKSGFRFDAAKSSARRRALDDLIGAVLIDGADAVKARRAKNPNDALAWTPIGEAEFNALAAKWEDQTLRNEQISKWTSAARAQWAK